MPKTSSRLNRVVMAGAILVAAATGGLAGTAPARAAGLETLVCETAASVNVVPGTAADQVLWAISGSGSCVGDLNGTYQAHVDLVGTSTGLGLCTGDVAVTDLKLDATLTLTSTATGTVRTKAERFYSPLTTFPIATPFLVSDLGGDVGAGNLDTHIFLHCPPGGTPAALLTWTQIG